MTDPETQPDQQQAGDKEEAANEVIATKVTSTTKWFKVKSGYGFIKRNDTKEYVFVHQTTIIKNNPKKAVRFMKMERLKAALSSLGLKKCSILRLPPNYCRRKNRELWTYKMSNSCKTVFSLLQKPGKPLQWPIRSYCLTKWRLEN